ncbi:peptidoglycan-binding protein [Microcoleus sp. FACHB-53]|jgi:peptidoglycan hydrolase-like protein with peptidoglycan-binding domain|nr:peptidoglycan-binding protein [Microcoleus sp. FACHB-53]
MPTAYMSQAPIKKASLKLPILRPGSSGSTVRVLQQLLNFKGFNLEIDGEFNSPTQEAVKEFQQMNGLGMEGIVDSQTWYYLSAGLLPLEC